MLHFLTRLHKTVFFLYHWVLIFSVWCLFKKKQQKKTKHINLMTINLKKIKKVSPIFLHMWQQQSFQVNKTGKWKKPSLTSSYHHFTPPVRQRLMPSVPSHTDKVPINKDFPFSIKSTDDSLKAEHKDRKKKRKSELFSEIFSWMFRH